MGRYGTYGTILKLFFCCSDDESSGVNPMVSKFAEEIDSDTEYDHLGEDTAAAALQDDSQDKMADKHQVAAGRTVAAAKIKPAHGFDSLFNTAAPDKGPRQQKAEETSDELDDFLGDPDPDLGPGDPTTAGTHDGYDSL